MWNDNEDKEFARKVTLRGMTDIELARLAEQKSSSPAVKQFAQQIVNDQGTANDELKRVAGSAPSTRPKRSIQNTKLKSPGWRVWTGLLSIAPTSRTS